MPRDDNVVDGVESKELDTDLNSRRDSMFCPSENEEDSESAYSGGASKFLSPKKKSNLENLRGYAGNRQPFLDFTENWLPEYPEVGTAVIDENSAFNEALDFFSARTRFVLGLDNFKSMLSEARFWEQAKLKIAQKPRSKRQLNQALLAFHHYVDFVPTMGGAPLPTIRAEPELNAVKQSVFTTYLNKYCGGFTKKELMCWMVEHAAHMPSWIRQEQDRYDGRKMLV